ncbi:MAG: transaldolase, partial [Anaerolineaceae bacterium]|nr:transaldolase [Anaerolineaceae bacterium]
MNIRSILYEMSQKTPTVLWNDSCSIQELTNSIEINNAVGATCNPTIVLTVLKKEWDIWKERIPQIIWEMPTASEDQIGWRVVEEMSQNASKLLLPVFERDKGKNGRLSIQTNPKYYRDKKAIL